MLLSPTIRLVSYDPIGGEERVSSFFLKRSLMFFGAIWVGSWVGGIALGTGIIAGAGWSGSSGIPIGMITFTAIIGALAAPLLLFSEAGIPNLLVLLFALVYFMRREDIGFLAWMILAGIESLVAMLGWISSLPSGWMPAASAWAGWLVSFSMLASGAWLLRQHRIHRWARHLALVNAENAIRRAEREASRPLARDRENGDHT